MASARNESLAAAALEGFSRPRLVLYLPLSLLVTLTVLALPALLAARLLPPHGLLSSVLCVALTVVLSLLMAGLEGAAWGGRGRRSDLVYSELLVWGLTRRWWAERRLSRLSAAYERATRADMTIRVELLEAIARLLEARNPHTYGHCRRVARHAEQIARAMHLSPAEVATIRTAALVHDVGKIRTPAEILHKPATLTEEELSIVRRHSVDGANMLTAVRDPSLEAIVRHHHERFAGKGYPDGLMGEEIPLGSRIIAVADTFDVITSRRAYRRARTQREAMAVLQAEAGIQLDRRVVDTFEECCSGRRSVMSVAIVTATTERISGALQILPGSSDAAVRLLPALGAAGLLAVAPAMRYERSPAHARAHPAGGTLGAAAASASAAGLARPASGDVGEPSASRGGAGGDTRDRAGVRPVADARAPNATAAPPASSAPNTSSQQPQASSDSSGSLGDGTQGGGGGAEEPSPPSTQEAPPTLLPRETPAVPITPAISTPAVTLPPVKLPLVSIPSLTVPAVELPPITLPGLKLP